MNNFDYSQQFAFGQYLPTGSLFHRLDARARILIFTILVIGVTASPSLIGLGIGLLVAILLLAISRVPVGYALRSLIPPLPFLLILAVLQVFISPGAADSPLLLTIGPLRIHLAGVIASAKLLVRFSALVLILNLAAFTLSSSEIIHGMRMLLKPLDRFGVRTQDWVLMIQVTLRFIPLLTLSAERIAKAQASRGAEWGTGRGGLIGRVREVTPLIVPLFLTTLRRAENLALAMDARAYGVSANPTSLITLQWNRLDTLMLLIFMSAAAAIVLL